MSGKRKEGLTNVREATDNKTFHIRNNNNNKKSQKSKQQTKINQNKIQPSSLTITQYLINFTIQFTK